MEKNNNNGDRVKSPDNNPQNGSGDNSGNGSDEVFLSNLPQHVAIVMDGNRRWAKERDLPHIEGHKEAVNRMRELVEYAGNIGIKYVTLWAWSTKNWKRDPLFIKDIMDLFRSELFKEEIFEYYLKLGAKVNLIGKLDGFAPDIVKRLNYYTSQHPRKKVLDVNIALGYEGRDEILRATRKIIGDKIPAEDVNEMLFSDYLDTAGQPDVDLMIRTGGEQRLSGYLLWQIADAELYFTKKYMPDFTVGEFKKALTDYAGRERRLGGDSKKY